MESIARRSVNSKWTIFLSLVFVGCQTQQQTKNETTTTELSASEFVNTATASNDEIGFHTDASQDFAIHIDQNSVADLPTMVKVPAEYLSVYRLSRTHVGLREGPGLAFPIIGDWLPQDSLLIGFEKAGPWQRVVSLSSFHQEEKAAGAIKGWVHEAVLTAENMRGEIFVPSQALPRMFARDTIRAITEAIDLKTIPSDIPKGTEAVMLKEQKSRRLMLFPEVMTAVWIDKNLID